MDSSSFHPHLIGSDQRHAFQQQPRRQRSFSVVSHDDKVSNSGADNDSCSGYSADEDEDSSTHWESIRIIEGSKRRRMSNSAERAKRRKLDENNFAASNAAADLDNAGLPYPEVNTSSSRTLHLDTSSVSLFSATSLQSSSPFLHSTDDECSTDRYSLLVPNLLAQSAPAYQGSTPIPHSADFSSYWNHLNDGGEDTTNSTIIGTGSFSVTRIPEQDIDSNAREIQDNPNDPFLPAQVVA